MDKILRAEHSRLLLCEGAVDEVLGFVYVKDLLAQVATGKPLDHIRIPVRVNHALHHRFY